jgi:hypothetical protein
LFTSPSIQVCPRCIIRFPGRVPHDDKVYREQLPPLMDLRRAYLKEADHNTSKKGSDTLDPAMRMCCSESGAAQASCAMHADRSEQADGKNCTAAGSPAQNNTGRGEQPSQPDAATYEHSNFSESQRQAICSLCMGLLQQEDSITLSNDETAVGRSQPFCVSLQQHPMCFQPISHISTRALLLTVARSGHTAESLGLQMQVSLPQGCPSAKNLFLAKAVVLV